MARARNRYWKPGKLEEIVGKTAVEAGKRALEEGANLVVKRAKELCPYDENHDKHNPGTPHLRDTIRVELKNKGAYAKVLTDYKTKSGWCLGALVEYSPKINHPFLKPAIEELKPTISRNIAEAIIAAMKGGK